MFRSRTRLNRFASDSSEKEQITMSTPHLNGVDNTNNSSSGLMSSYSSISHVDSYSNDGKSSGTSMVDGGVSSSMSKRQYSTPSSLSSSSTSVGTSGRYVPLSERISPPSVADSLRVSFKQFHIYTALGQGRICGASSRNAKAPILI